MSLKNEMSKEAWEQVMLAPFIAGFAVTAADPGGLIGAVQESAAMAKALRSAEEASAEGSVASEILAEIKTSDGRGLIKAGLKDMIKGRSPAEASEAAVARLKETMSLVSRTAPAQYASMSELVRQTAKGVAEAANEGGFMGFGGVAVSDAEKKTLADIEDAIATAQV